MRIFKYFVVVCSIYSNANQVPKVRVSVKSFLIPNIFVLYILITKKRTVYFLKTDFKTIV